MTGSALFDFVISIVLLLATGFVFFLVIDIGIIVILAVLYILDLILTWIAAQMGASGEIVNVVKYIIFAVALIAMLLADRTLIGGQYTNFLGVAR